MSTLTPSLTTACSYNMGSNTSDFFRACEYGNPTLHFASREEEEKFRETYAKAQQSTAERLLANPPSLFFLQEVNSTERPLTQTLESQNYQIFHKDNEPFDTAVALSTEHFKDIENISFIIKGTDTWKNDVALVKATDQRTNRRMAFVSTHTPGFSFDEMKAAPTPEDKERLGLEGDYFSEKLIEILSKMSDVDVIVIGSDMNANPQIWSPRFKLFEKAGFKILHTGSPTNVNPRDESDKLRELDFFFVKENTSLRHRLSSLFKKTVHLHQAVIQPDIKPLHSDRSDNPFDSKKNASDHLPIYAEISTYQKSPIDKLGTTPFIGTLTGCGRLVVGLVASAISTLAWGVFALLSKETTQAKQWLSWSLQHLSMGGIELLPCVKLGLEKHLTKKDASITLRETTSAVNSASIGGRKTLGQLFWSLLNQPNPAPEVNPTPTPA